MRVHSALLVAVALTSGCAWPAASARPTPLPSPSAIALYANLVTRIGPFNTPEAVAAGFGSIWVPSHRGGTLFRIDPITNKATEIHGVNAFATTGVVVFGAGSVWIGVWPATTGREWIRVDPSSNAITARIAVAGRGAFGGGYLWLYDGVELFQVDPATDTVIDSIKVTKPDSLTDVAYGAGSVWVATLESGVFRLDPTTKKTIARIDTVAWLVESDGTEVWTVDVATGSVSRIDTMANRVAATVDTGRPGSATEGVFAKIVGGITLVYGVGLLTVLDTASATIVKQYELLPGDGSTDVEVAFGSLWIANFGNDDVSRFRWPLAG